MVFFLVQLIQLSFSPPKLIEIIFVSCLKDGLRLFLDKVSVVQAGLELSILFSSVCQIGGITDLSHRTQLDRVFT